MSPLERIGGTDPDRAWAQASLPSVSKRLHGQMLLACAGYTRAPFATRMTVPEIFQILMSIGDLLGVLATAGAPAVDPSQGPLEVFIGTYGPIAMIVLLLASGVGVPIGEEIVNIPAGIFVGRGEMSAPTVYLAAYIGVLAGDFLWFFICRRLGKQLLHRKWFKRLAHPRKLLQVKHKFDRRGPWVLVVARFIPGTRSPALTIAGILHMQWKTFIFIEFILCAITTVLQVTIGVLIGRQLVNESIGTTILASLAVVAGIVAVIAVIAWLTRSRVGTGPTPRERIAWLRKYRPRRSTPSAR